MYVNAVSGNLRPVSGRQDLTVDNTAGGVSLTVPAGAVAAVARNETAQIRYTLDGTAPTTTVGIQVEAGDTLEFESEAEMTAFKAIRTGGTSGTLHIEYFKIG